jgi:hypothetical protein
MEFDSLKPENYSLGERATFENTDSGCWIVSRPQQDTPLELKFNKNDRINFWDWEPYKLVQNYLMTEEEFDQKDYFHLVIGR